MKPTILILLALVLLLSACEGDPGAGSSVIEDFAGFQQALEVQSATVTLDSTLEQTFFSVPATVLLVNGEAVQVYEYATPQAMQADAALVSPDGGSIGTNMLMWISTPHFYSSGRIIVLYVGVESSMTGLLSGLLGEPFAGP